MTTFMTFTRRKEKEGAGEVSAEVLLVSPVVFHVCLGSDMWSVLWRKIEGWRGKSPNTIITGAIQSNKMKRY